MKLLMISSDTSAFNPKSAFAMRLSELGEYFSEIHVIIKSGSEYYSSSIGDNISLWPTGSKGIWHIFREYSIGSWILREGADEYAITSQEEFGGIAAWLLSRKFRVPWQAQVHTDIASQYFASHSLKNRIRAWIARFLLPKATCVRVVSGRIAKGLAENGFIKNSARVLPISSSLPYSNTDRDYSDPLFDFVILMVCRLESEKNVSAAITAFSEVIKTFPQTTLRIVGDGAERKSLETLSASLGLGAHIQFEGERDDVSPYYISAHMFLSSSLYEGYGLSVAEAMSAGLPIVMTDVGIAGDLVRDGETGFVVSVGDEKAFKDAILRLRADANLRQQIGKAAFEESLKITPREKYAEAFRDTILSCSQKK